MKIWLVLAFCLAIASALPKPQNDDESDEVDLESIDTKASDAQRYGTNTGNLDQTSLEEIFGDLSDDDNINTNDNVPEDKAPAAPVVDDNYGGSNQNIGVPDTIEVNTDHATCDDYWESGYSCVPYFQCRAGHVIIDGEGLFNPRFGGLNDVELNPDISKCPGDLEMCCRHPDYKDTPIINPFQDIVVDPNDGTLQPGDDGYVDPNVNDGLTDPQPGDPNYVDPNTNVNENNDGGYVDPNTNVNDNDDGYVDPNPNVPLQPGDDGYVDPNVNDGLTDPQPGDPNYVDPNGNDGGYVDPNSNDPNYVDPNVNDGLNDVDPNNSGTPYTDDDHLNPQNAYQPQCGRHNLDGVGVRIVAGAGAGETQFGEWPHMCAVLNRTVIAGTKHSLYVCGGSLIAPNVVLTAAHCVE